MPEEIERIFDERQAHSASGPGGRRYQESEDQFPRRPLRRIIGFRAMGQDAF